MKKLLIFLIICLDTISLWAQSPPLPTLPPMPPGFYPTNFSGHFADGSQAAPMNDPAPRGMPPQPVVKTHSVTCLHCGHRCRHLKPTATISVVQNDVLPDNRHCIVTALRNFICAHCGQPFVAQTKETVPIPLAVEDVEPLPPPSGSGSSSIQSWTTNANLRLSIEILNKTNVLVLTGVTNNATISNTVTLGISPFPMAAVRFPTELGKTYKCQASDDAKRTWLDGPIVAGTGNFVTNYEMPLKISRIYRVVENPL